MRKYTDDLDWYLFILMVFQIGHGGRIGLLLTVTEVCRRTRIIGQEEE